MLQTCRCMLQTLQSIINVPQGIAEWWLFVMNRSVVVSIYTDSFLYWKWYVSDLKCILRPVIVVICVQTTIKASCEAWCMMYLWWLFIMVSICNAFEKWVMWSVYNHDLSFNISFLIIVLVKWQQSLTGYRALLWTLLWWLFVLTSLLCLIFSKQYIFNYQPYDTWYQPSMLAYSTCYTGAIHALHVIKLHALNNERDNSTTNSTNQSMFFLSVSLSILCFTVCLFRWSNMPKAILTGSDRWLAFNINSWLVLDLRYDYC